MAGGVGYLQKEDRTFESLAKLKSTIRKEGAVREWRFSFTQATGGAGAALEVEEKTGTTVSRLTTGNEAQVYIRAHTDDAAYAGKFITTEGIDEAGTVLDAVATEMDANAVTEVAVSGMTTFYRLRDLFTDAVIQAGHTLSCGDADHANDGSGNDLWGVIEEGNYSSRHSRYYVPVTSSSGGAMKGYLAKIDGYYEVVGEYCTLTIGFTPKAKGSETAVATTMNFVLTADSPLHWESPFQLEGATDVTFTVTDDAATGGNFYLETIIVESEGKVAVETP